MESNGKSVDINNEKLQVPASPLIWGEPGTNAQHSFFQYLHQGLEKQSLDILIPLPTNIRGGVIEQTQDRIIRVGESIIY